MRAWKRYLFWVLLGDRGGWPLPDPAAQLGTQVVARALLNPEERFAASITTEDKVKAAIYLMELDKTLTPEKHVLSVVVDAMDGDTVGAAKVVEALDREGWLRGG